MEYSIGKKVFENWEIVEKLGEGANGQVFEIHKTDFGITTKSALKVICIPRSKADVTAVMSEGMDRDSVTAYFQGFVDEIVKEIAVMSGLKGHPNIVTYEDHCVLRHDDGPGWDILIRMELLTPLTDYLLKNQDKVNEEFARRLGKELCGALVYCQNRNMVHRDIKPENIFVNESGHFKLGDFGIARTIEKTTGGLSKKGTESYMAPEVYLGKAYGADVDLYSLGLVLYKLLNGNRLPFLPPYPQPITYSDREDAISKRMQGQPLPPVQGVGKGITDIIFKACAYDRDQRYHMAAEMLADLERLDGRTENSRAETKKREPEKGEPKKKESEKREPEKFETEKKEPEKNETKTTETESPEIAKQETTPSQGGWGKKWIRLSNIILLIVAVGVIFSLLCFDDGAFVGLTKVYRFFRSSDDNADGDNGVSSSDSEALDPDLTEARNYYDAGDYDTALEIYKQYQGAHPDQKEGYSGLVDCYVAMHDFETAKKTIEEGQSYDACGVEAMWDIVDAFRESLHTEQDGDDMEQLYAMMQEQRYGMMEDWLLGWHQPSVMTQEYMSENTGWEEYLAYYFPDQGGLLPAGSLPSGYGMMVYLDCTIEHSDADVPWGSQIYIGNMENGKRAGDGVQLCYSRDWWYEVQKGNWTDQTVSGNAEFHRFGLINEHYTYENGHAIYTGNMTDNLWDGEIAIHHEYDDGRELDFTASAQNGVWDCLYQDGEKYVYADNGEQILYETSEEELTWDPPYLGGEYFRYN